MAKSLSYKKATTVTLNVKGIYDAENGTIELADVGETKSVIDLLKDFEDLNIELTAKVRSEEDLQDNLDE